jgi:hypothetical protein
MNSVAKNVRLQYGTYQCLMALAGELQAEKGNRVTADETVSMLLSEHLDKEIDTRQSRS